MTARVIAQELDEYAEHVATVSDRLASTKKWSDRLAGQSFLDQDDLSQVMRIKGWEGRSQVHSSTCGWPDDPGGERGRPACCGLMCASLRNAAYNELAREWNYRGRIADRPGDTEGTSDDRAGEAVEVADAVSASVDLHSALAKLPPEQRDAVWSVTAQENTLAEAASDLGIPLQTVAYRQRVALMKLKLLVSLTP